MMLEEFPQLKKDKVMMRAYMFLLDFLEAVSKETSEKLKINQQLLKSLMEACKLSEESLDSFIAGNHEKVDLIISYFDTIMTNLKKLFCS